MFYFIRTALSYAVINNNESVAELLLKYGSDVNALDSVNRYMKTIIIYYANEIFYVLFPKLNMCVLNWSIEKGLRNMVKLLLKNGANPNIKSKFGETGFDIARDYGFHDILEMLLPHTNTTPNSPKSLSLEKIPTRLSIKIIHNNLQLISFINDFFILGFQNIDQLNPAQIQKLSQTMIYY